MGAAQVGHLAQGVLEAGTLGGIQGTAGDGPDGASRGVAGGQCGGAEFFLGVRGQRFEPKPFGVVVEGEEVTAVALEADGFAHGHPAGGFAAGAGAGFGIGEGFGQQRRVAAVREPLVGQRGGGGGQDLGGEVGAAGGVRDEGSGPG